MHRLSCCLLAALIAGATVADEKPVAKLLAKAKAKPDIVPGYELRMIEGFTVFINRTVFAEIEAAKGEFTVAPLEVLESELRALNTILTPKVLKPMQTVRIFVEWDDVPPGSALSEEEKARGARVVAVYRTGLPQRAVQEGRIPLLKMNAVEIMTLRRLSEMHQPGRDKAQIVLLHELCHTVHHVFLGFENRDVLAAYAQAMDRKLYSRAYAQKSAPEYFAEISCAYLDQCNFFPHSADELREHDPIGYRLMEGVWGKQDKIQTARVKVAADRAARERVRKQLAGTPSITTKPDPERTAKAKLDLIKMYIDDGKTDRARTKLRELIEAYPETKAAAEAVKLLGKM